MRSPGASAMRTLAAAARLQSRLSEALQPSGLTVDRWRCLACVDGHPGASMSDLVEALALAPATATRAVDALVETGALYRDVDPADRRRVVLRVSAPGTALLRDVEAAVALAETDPAVLTATAHPS